jgi:antagonist of KipI
MSTIRIAKAGMATTVQDKGRLGLRHLGVVASGAMDLVSYEMANLLVGNEAGAAALEMTCLGDTLEILPDTLIAICGADMCPQFLDSKNANYPIPQNRPVHIRSEGRLRFGNAREGFRAYVAIAGGIDVPEIMHSRSTYLRAGVGGFQGRMLKTGDLLRIGPESAKANYIKQRLARLVGSTSSVAAPRWFARVFDPPSDGPVPLQVIEGTHFNELTQDSQQALYQEAFQVTASSDRMGYRLSGPGLKFVASRELLSEGVSIGTLQLPSEGDPILLMSDGAPTGGYRRIAHVITADLPVAAQVHPGQMIMFQPVSISEAHRQLYEQRKRIDQISNSMELWMDGTIP